MPLRKRRPHFSRDPFCACRFCRDVRAIYGETEGQIEYRRREWPGRAFTDLDLAGLHRAEALIEEAFDDDGSQHITEGGIDNEP